MSADGVTVAGFRWAAVVHKRGPNIRTIRCASVTNQKPPVGYGPAWRLRTFAWRVWVQYVVTSKEM